MNRASSRDFGRGSLRSGACLSISAVSACALSYAGGKNLYQTLNTGLQAHSLEDFKSKARACLKPESSRFASAASIQPFGSSRGPFHSCLCRGHVGRLGFSSFSCGKRGHPKHESAPINDHIPRQTPKRFFKVRMTLQTSADTVAGGESIHLAR